MIGLLHTANIVKNTKETQNHHLESEKPRSCTLDPDTSSNLSAEGFVRQALGALCVLGGSPFRVLTVRSWQLLLSVMLCSSTAQAMEIQKFDMMSSEDRQAYMDFLPEAAQRLLIEAGRKDDAAKVYKLFTEISTGNVFSDGEIAFVENLDRARVADIKKHAENHGARRLEVEDALFVTLKKAGVVLPQTFFGVGKDFKPKHPPKDEKK